MSRSSRSKSKLVHSVGALAIVLVVLLENSLSGVAPARGADTWWKPDVGITWQIQIGSTPKPGEIIPGLDAYDIDLFEITPAQIAALRNSGPGTKIICYFSAGTYEEWRPDRKQFPKKAIGKPLDDWPGESYLDIRNARVRAIMEKRLDLAKQKGCDAVDPDNVDAYQNNNGFKLKAKHQLSFNRFLAREAHERGMGVGLKNDISQIPQLVNAFDFMVNEECFEYNECDTLNPFIAKGKPVLGIEYGNFNQVANRVCAEANQAQFSTLIKKLNLKAARKACN